MLEFPVRNTQVQGTRVETQHLTAARLQNDRQDEQGPDLAFVRLPTHTASSLSANSSFLNFERQLTLFSSPPAEELGLFDTVAGLVAEWESSPVHRHGYQTTQQRALLSLGKAERLSNGRNGLDRYLFTATPDEDFKMPSSHGATSGGPWFRPYRKPGTTDIDHVRLMGVAFYERPLEGGKRDLVCHGPESLYQHLAPVIRQKWADEI
jgi:hypothetical protein